MNVYVANDAIKCIAEETVKGQRNRQRNFQTKTQKEDKLLDMFGTFFDYIKQTAESGMDEREMKSSQENAQKNDTEPKDDGIDYAAIRRKYEDWITDLALTPHFDVDTVDSFDTFLEAKDNEDKQKKWLWRFNRMLERKVDTAKMMRILKVFAK